MNKLLLLLVSGMLLNNISSSQNMKLKPFISVGSSGIGFGLNFKEYNLYSRYSYNYEQPSPSMYYYYHFPSIMLTKKIYNEEIGNVYAGLGFSNVVYKQKYFIQGINTTNYFIAIPLGIQLIPFKRNDKFSITLESGIEFEHMLPLRIHPLVKGYDWGLNLSRGIVDIRYKLGKRSN
jgi:hypothetical protein